MKIMHATRVVKVYFLSKVIAKPKEARCRQNSSQRPNQNCKTALTNGIRRCADSYTTGKCCTHNKLHIESLQGDTGNTAGCNAASGN